MKVLLLTDIPPCYEYTAGLVLNSLVRFLPHNQIALCAIINPHLTPKIPEDLKAIPRLLLKKPRESGFKTRLKFIGNILTFLFEYKQSLTVKYKLLPQIADFAAEQKVDILWVVLQGQTIIRLARKLSLKLNLPLYTQVWDPFEWWLRSNHIDTITKKKLLAEFDKVLLHSKSCATASWKMSENYTHHYGVKNLPLISSLSTDLARSPATTFNSENEFIIAIAGQIYATTEWDALIGTLDEINWVIQNRRIRIRVLANYFALYSQKPRNFEYLGWQSQSDTIRLLAESDLLYLPYWFSQKFYQEAENSFPSKLVSYFAAGRPVFCHAPAYASPTQYLKKYQAGYLCESLDSKHIIQILEQVISDPKQYAQIAKNGTHCFFRDFTLEKMQENFYQFLEYKYELTKEYLNKLDYYKDVHVLHENPKVSIIIPVYNGANYLKEAIDSALAQSYHNIEVLVINDGSNDNGETEKIALSYGEKIRFFNKASNDGVASALNVALREMTGDYFSWLSHDDLYTEDKISKQIDFLFKLNCANTVIYSDYSAFTTDAHNCTIMKMKNISPENFRFWITFQNALHGCTLLIPTSAFLVCGTFNEKLLTTQDYDLWFRIAEYYKFIHLPEPLVKARHHIQQGTHTMAKTALYECNKLLAHFTKNLSLHEVQQGGGCSPCLAYAQLASSMWYRGYFPAGWTAACLSIQHSVNVKFREIILSQCILMQGVFLHFIVKPIRKFLPSYIRLKLKNSLRLALKSYPSISIKERIKLFLMPPDKKSQRDSLLNLHLHEKFTQIYKNNLFEGAQSRSGEGSNLEQTAIIRKEIPGLLKQFHIKSFLDAACGDWYWMRETQLGVRSYIGLDIVQALIDINKKKYGNETTTFKCLNLVTDPLPKADLIFSRDCLVHLSFEDSINVLKNFKNSGATYLLVTTYSQRDLNSDLETRFWRPLNLQLPPFNFPPPLYLINENCSEGDGHYMDKCLGLWRLEDLTLAI